MSAQVAPRPLEHEAATGAEPASLPPADGTAAEAAALQERLAGYFSGALTANLIHLGDRWAVKQPPPRGARAAVGSGWH